MQLLMSTMLTPFEAEDGVSGEVDGSTLSRPLLSDDFLDEDNALVTQLISTSDRSERQSRNRQVNRKRRLACSFAVLSLIGFFASGWSTFFSCDLVAVRYPTGGVQLLVTAFGVWGYQQKVAKKSRSDSASDDDNDNNNSKHAWTRICVGYDGIQKNHQDVDLKDFFPVKKTIQAYSIVSVSSYIAAMVAIFIFLLISLAHPEVFTGSESIEYPATGMTSSVAAAACFFLVAGVFHSLLISGLLHFSESGTNPNSQSASICSPAHSYCHIGLGGYWIVFTIWTSFACGVVASVAAYNIRRIRARRSTRFC
jgi:hypothetical protein